MDDVRTDVDDTFYFDFMPCYRKLKETNRLMLAYAVYSVQKNKIWTKPVNRDIFSPKKIVCVCAFYLYSVKYNIAILSRERRSAYKEHIINSTHGSMNVRGNVGYLNVSFGLKLAKCQFWPKNSIAIIKKVY